MKNTFAPGETINATLSTRNPATGAAMAPTGTPTGYLLRNNVISAISVVIAAVPTKTTVFSVTIILPAIGGTLALGDDFTVMLVATVNGVSDEWDAFSFEVGYPVAVDASGQVTIIPASITAMATAVWAVGTRTLTGFSTLAADTATAVWASGSRTLTGFGTLAADTTTAVWAAGSRTLTGFGTLAADVTTAVWAAGSRTLTGFGTLVSDAATAVWAAGARTLTTFGFTVATDLDTDIAEIKANTDKFVNLSDDQIEVAIKQLSNRVTVEDGVMTIYDNDNTTVLQAFTLTPIAGNAGYSERVPE